VATGGDAIGSYFTKPFGPAYYGLGDSNEVKTGPRKVCGVIATPFDPTIKWMHCARFLNPKEREIYQLNSIHAPTYAELGDLGALSFIFEFEDPVPASIFTSQ